MTKSDFKITKAAALAIAMIALMTAAAPALTPQAAITTRQADFKAMGGAMKAMGEQIKSAAPVKATMVASAQTLATAAHELPGQFPAGSDASAGVKTDALPAIWTDRANFDAQMAKLGVETTTLLAVANSSDITAITAQFKATGAVCGGCHRQFRAES